MHVEKAESDLEKRTSQGDLQMEGFIIHGMLGEGSYCEVRSAFHRGEKIAVKIITRKDLTADFKTKFLPREIQILGQIDHENIVKVFQIFSYPERVYIFMEFIDGGDLLYKIRTYGRMPGEEASLYFCQLVDALCYLHDLNIAHRDVKCENVMITEGDVVKLIDFGFSRITVDAEGKRQLSRTFCGSMAYAAPEVLQGYAYNPMMYDVWSLGCVLFIMVTGTMPFDDGNVRKMVRAQYQKRFKYPTTFQVQEPVKKLIGKMLEPDLTKRIFMRWVSRNKWVQSGRQRTAKKTASPVDSGLPSRGESTSTAVQTKVSNPWNGNGASEGDLDSLERNW